MVVHHDRVRGTAAARDVERERPARDRDDARTGVRGQLRQQRAEEADADDRDRLAGLDAAAAEDVDRAAERLARHRHAVAAPPAARTTDVGLGDVVLGVRAIGQRGHAVADARGRSTPAPTATTRPQPSCPGAPGGCG